MKVKNNKAMDFLLYSYFGIADQDENRTSVGIKCAYRAYQDLARTVKYTYSTSKLDVMSKKSAKEEEQKQAKEYKGSKVKLIEKICSQIIKQIYNDNINDFNEWHKGKCTTIKKIMNEAKTENNIKIVEKFTYGQAQKWINMTLKYLWLLDLLPKSINEKDIHVPVDGYIIEAATYNCSNHADKLEITLDITKIPWSDWEDSNDYQKFQDQIREKISGKYNSSIEWESKAWIEVAKKRSEK